MFNFNFLPPVKNEDRFLSSFGLFSQTERPDGSVSFESVENPYEGLLGSSFSLDAQIQAGVPLQKIGKVSSGLLSEVDRSNSNASNFVDSLKFN